MATDAIGGSIPTMLTEDSWRDWLAALVARSPSRASGVVRVLCLASTDGSVHDWLCQYMRPTSDGVSFDDILFPFQHLRPEVDGVKIEVTSLSGQVDPCLDAEGFWRAAGITQPAGLYGSTCGLFDIIVLTPLLCASGWRIGLARALRLLKPGGIVLYPRLDGDARILVGQPAERGDTSGPGYCRWLCCLSWLYRQLEELFHSSYIPELSLCCTGPLDDLMQDLGEVLLDDSIFSFEAVMAASATDAHPNVLSVGHTLMKLPAFSVYLSPVEQRRLKTELETGCLECGTGGAARDTSAALCAVCMERGGPSRPVVFRSLWRAVQVKGPRTTDIDAAVVRSFYHPRRSVLDTRHNLLPRFEPDPGTETPKDGELVSFEEKVLRSLRGFMCRMLHQDRFDPEHQHFFMASLWVPKEDAPGGEMKQSLGKRLGDGSLSPASGIIFRARSPEPDDVMDEALRQLTYIAHAHFNQWSLQSIPQRLFWTSRPSLRVAIGCHGDDWAFRAYGQEHYDATDELDPRLRGADLSEVPVVPSQIEITIPQVAGLPEKWARFRRQWLDPILHLTVREACAEASHGTLEISGDEGSQHLGAAVHDVFWRVVGPRLYTCPYDAAIYYYWDLPSNRVRVDKAKREGLSRGQKVALILELLERRFTESGCDLIEAIEGNLDEHAQLVTRDRLKDALCRFLKAQQVPEERFLADDGGWKEQSDRLYKALLSLHMAFPLDGSPGRWELVQNPVGVFLVGATPGVKGSVPDDPQSRYVSAGNAILIRSAEFPPDDRLRQCLAQIRSMQLKGQVPSTLLPLATLMYVHRLRDAELQAVSTKAAAAEWQRISDSVGHALKAPYFDLNEAAKRITDLTAATPPAYDKIEECAAEMQRLLEESDGIVMMSSFLSEAAKGRANPDSAQYTYYWEPVPDFGAGLTISADYLTKRLQRRLEYARIYPRDGWDNPDWRDLRYSNVWTIKQPGLRLRYSNPNRRYIQREHPAAGAASSVISEILINSIRYNNDEAERRVSIITTVVGEPPFQTMRMLVVNRRRGDSEPLPVLEAGGQDQWTGLRLMELATLALGWEPLRFENRPANHSGDGWDQLTGLSGLPSADLAEQTGFSRNIPFAVLGFEAPCPNADEEDT